MRLLILSWLFVFSFLPITETKAEIICTLLSDAKSAVVLLEEGDCSSQVTPASTFKIPLAVMAYDANILTDTHSPVMSFRKGDPDWGVNWKSDTDPKSWLRFSVLWYSQRIAHAMGARSLTQYAQKFSYGNADFSGDSGFDNGLERAWIASSLKVSPHEQANFLRALLTDTLPVSAAAMFHTRDIIETRDVDGWVFHGKTGGAYPRRADRSFDYAKGIGWYVGWVQMGERTLIFVRLTQASERHSGSPGTLTRDAFFKEWPDLVKRSGL
ncbi:class D beta-lactamase [Brucellaceae bacterium C25G]